ncbi:vesicle-associated membrane protein 2 isoform X1 [Ceratitis capitata]|uniref:vesicle-associated membrane protein 2 isoform X1 n=1 Tax=Ceratitis capitata TaxID=7213 RepID=UPI00032A3C38|nr:vesicle-associated membrane protein 2 isoform X1 [Ceratitis capitata]XP_012157289.1 vesicle-associated membrane protein 2 isoform X1 [Ceratitis capitata]XP_020714538.1 vesicle-associated membrane protein 2 isoform X1 [Ceratitis capitata]
MGKKDKKKEEAEPAPAADAPPADNAAGEGGDGEIVGGPRNPQQIAAQKRLQQTQAQVDEVVDIMRTNVEKVLERDQKLSELDDRADALQQGASQFEQQAGKLKRKFWLQNLKMMIIMGVIGLVIVGIIANKLGLIGGETQPQYPQYPQYMPPPPPQQQAQAPAAGTSSLADDGSVGNKEQHGAV